jgi:hypothetical protein
MAIGKRLAIIVAGVSATLLLALAMSDGTGAARTILGSVAAAYVAALAVSLPVRPN